jgi:hypothetical protein
VGYQSAATFQPLFGYESVLDLLVAVAVTLAIRRYALSGDRAFAVYAALWTAVGAAIQALRIDYSPRLLGLRTNMLAMLVVLVAACGYLTATRNRRVRLGVTVPRAPELAGASGSRVLRPRSSRATAAELAPGGIWAAMRPGRHNPVAEPEESPPGSGP